MASQHPIRRADLLDSSVARCCFHVKFLSFYFWGNKAHSLHYFCLDQRIHSRPFYADARIVILSSKKQSHNTRVVNTASARKKIAPCRRRCAKQFLQGKAVCDIMISPLCTKRTDHSMTLPSLAALGGSPKLGHLRSAR
jgi:hypothetical protein